MSKLNEDVLRLIFDYIRTPSEWIQISEVCQLWKAAATKHWRNITEINDLEYDLNTKSESSARIDAPVISAKDAERITKCAAPFVKVLRAFTCVNKKEPWIMFGSFLYRVRDFDPDAILVLLAQNATKITEIVFDKPPKTELLKQLLNTNNVTTIQFYDCRDFYKDVPTENIEKLVVRFNSREIKSFAGHFPKLKNLDLTIKFEEPTEPKQSLSLILPHVLGLTSFRLYLDFGKENPTFDDSLSCKVLMDIARFSGLEHLNIHFFCIKVTAVDSFIKKIAKGCPKLRTVRLREMEIYEKQLSTLLNLPCLESLNIGLVSSFQSVQMPETTNLSELKMEYKPAKFDIGSFCSTLKSMPKLKNLEMRTDLFSKFKFGFEHTDNESFRLVCQVVTEATSWNKDVVIFARDWEKRKMRLWKIARARTANSDFEVQTLNLGVSFVHHSKFFEKLNTFVRNNLDNHCLVKL